jgi:hypothetical protein
MATSLTVLWFTTGNLAAILWSGSFMMLVAIWGWRYPGDEEEYARRVREGKKIAWLK